MITYRLNRWYLSPLGVIGDLYRMGELIGFSLEPPKDRDFGPAIPAGTYGLSWERSPKLGIFTPRLNGVPERSGILIHAGNTIKDTDGCILVGSGWAMASDKSLYLTGSRFARDAVYEKIKDDLSDGGFAEIEIAEHS